MKMKSIIIVTVTAFVSTVAAMYLYQKWIAPKQTAAIIENTPAYLTSGYMASKASQPIDFRYAAAAATPAVVHVKSKIKTDMAAMRGSDPFKDMFGDDFFQFFQGPNPYRNVPREQEATGSGVIISADGYVVTNNHVVDGAQEIEITLHNNKAYKAKVIGKDKDTDIALLKVEDSDLPFVKLANSDSVLVGEWVLAVGNPFNLSSTVTAGIVSAKGRNINILGGGNTQKGNTAIESFIQTDAAVNPGNSGGALVNVNGELVGINTAIASPTGTYAGYSFAVPSNIVHKIVMDLKKFGTTQRGYLGVNIKNVDNELAKELKLDKPVGVYVENVNKGSAADEAGVKSKDVITKINGFAVNSSPELQEQVAKYSPGDKIDVELFRDGKLENIKVELKNKYNTTKIVENSSNVLETLGVKLENLSAKEKQQLGVNNGVKVIDISTDGKLAEFTDIKKGFVILQVDDEIVTSVDDFTKMLQDKSGRVVVEGVYPNKAMSFLYAFKM